MRIRKIIIVAILIFFAIVIYKYSVHPVVLRTLFPDKIWPHRVNSIEKLQETTKIFSGMELDVVWKEDRFDVNHPPAKTINLYLNEFLANIPPTDKFGLWIDYKNLEESWAQKSADHIDSLFQNENLIKDKIYIESHSTPNLVPFADKGYKTSYYLPSNLGRVKDKDSLAKLLRLIDSRLENAPNLFISAPLADYYFMDKHYSERKKILWHLGGLYGPANKLKIYTALLDDKVEVILLPFVSKTGNR